MGGDHVTLNDGSEHSDFFVVVCFPGDGDCFVINGRISSPIVYANNNFFLIYVVFLHVVMRLLAVVFYGLL